MGIEINCSTGQETTNSDVAPVVTPERVTNLQFRKALRGSGRAAAFKTYFTGLSEAEQEEWQFAAFILRNSTMVSLAATALGVTNGQVNTLFQQAATL